MFRHCIKCPTPQRKGIIGRKQSPFCLYEYSPQRKKNENKEEVKMVENRRGWNWKEEGILTKEIKGKKKKSKARHYPRCFTSIISSNLQSYQANRESRGWKERKGSRTGWWEGKETSRKRIKRKGKCVAGFHPPERAYTISPNQSVYQHLSGGQFPGIQPLASFLFLPGKSLLGISGFVCSFVYLNIAKFVTKEWWIYLLLYSLIDISMCIFLSSIG